MGTSPLVTVPLPTVTGREHYLEKAIASYEAYANVELLIYHDLDGCGEAWARGIEEGKGDYFHMGADDVEMHPGWWEGAQRLIDLNFLPAARILNTDGTVQSCGRWGVELPDGFLLTDWDDFTRAPTFSRKQWELLGPLVDPFLRMGTHYYTDNIFTWAGNKVGIKTVLARNYEYTHHMAQEKRGAGTTWENRMQADYEKYVQYTTSLSSLPVGDK